MNPDVPHLRLSSPAKAGDPVFRDVYAGFDKPLRTGYSAFAEYDGFRRSNDDLLPSSPAKAGESSIPTRR